MAFAAAAIPIAVSLLGAMSKKDDPQPQQQGPRPPTLGETASMNTQPYLAQSNYSLPQMGTFQSGPIGGGQRGNNG